MATESEERFLATRASLLVRLANWQDRVSWNRFFELYWRLIYSTAKKSGLADCEAEEAVQETVIAVAKHIDRFRYDPSRGSFKSWLLSIARNKITDQFRKRDQTPDAEHRELSSEPVAEEFEKLWDAEWRGNLVESALQQLKREVEPLQFQIFHCYVIKQWDPSRVAKTLGVSTGQVYLAKNRIGPKFRAIVERLERDGV